MAQTTINVGVVANDGTGDGIRLAGTSINTNFTELFNRPSVLSHIAFDGNNITSTLSNADIVLGTVGTGNVDFSNLLIEDNIYLTNNEIKTTQSNSNLELSGSSSGSVNITSSATVLGVTTTGNVNHSGHETVTGQVDVDGITIKDNTIATNSSNADLVISASSSGVVKIDDIDIGGGEIDNTVIGANTAVAGTFTTLFATTLSSSGVTITDNEISATQSNDNLELSGSSSGATTISGLSYPTVNGTTNYVLKTNGNSTLSWTSSPIILSNSLITDGTATISSSSVTAIDSFTAATYRSAKYNIQVVDATNSRYEIIEANITHDGSNAYVSTFGRTTNYSEDLINLSADINSGSVRLLGTINNSSSHVIKFVRRIINI